MMFGILLDTHAMLWLIAGEPISDAAVYAINQAQRSNSLFVSPMTAWEIAVGNGKTNPAKRPNLQGLPPNRWFREGTQALGAIVPPITLKTALETGTVPSIYGSGDPGDCFLIATARVRKLALVTRDAAILALADRVPGYLSVIPC